MSYTFAAKAQGDGLAPAGYPEVLRQTVAESQWAPEYVPYEL
jgi:hypothetical protein